MSLCAINCNIQFLLNFLFSKIFPITGQSFNKTNKSRVKANPQLIKATIFNIGQSTGLCQGNQHGRWVLYKDFRNGTNDAY